MKGAYDRRKRKPITILMAEDDADDRVLVEDAFRESHVASSMRFVEDGVELLDYLRRQGKYKDAPQLAAADLILLDLSMPRKDGREALAEIKADPHLRHIPVVVLTASKNEEDILRSYDIGAAGCITKPATFEGLVEVTKVLGKYWFEVVELPS